MNSLKYIFRLFCLVAVLVSCKKDSFDDVSFVQSANLPNQLSALFDITQDNTGLVTITPNGESASYYDIYFGDGTTTPARVNAGANITHTYAEGIYPVKIVAYNVTGKVKEVTQQLTVSFKAPENLEVTTNFDPSSTFKLNVSATAKFETLFKVYFGDVANEVPMSFLEGQTVSHMYTAVGTYTLRVVALSGGAATTQVTKTITVVNPVVLPLDFESSSINYAFNNFDGGAVTVINNPNSSGINTSAKVAKMVKGAGQPWGGSAITIGSNINFSSNKVFRMKVYSPRIGAKVLLKVENAANGGLNFEKEVSTTVANAWEDLAFDFGSINTANTYQNIVIIFDLGTVGNGSANFTFLFDDIRQTNAMPVTLGQINLPVTFDNAAINYAVTDFEGNVTIDAVDPTNAANKVKKSTKPVGAQPWAGTTVSTPAGFATKIPISATAKKMSLRVYSPMSGIKVRLKIEDHTDPTKSVETEAITTGVNTWETLVFDFSNQASGTAALNLGYTYDMASVFFDFLQPAIGKVFYWDDLQMAAVSTNQLNLPLTFESSTLSYNITDFEGGATTIVANPSSTGINTSAKVAKMVKGAAADWVTWAGGFFTLDNPIDFSVKKIIKMKVYSPTTGKVLLKVENLTDGNINVEKEVNITAANTWQELTFDFTGISTTNSYQKIVIIFNNGTKGDASANFTYYFDDITLN